MVERPDDARPVHRHRIGIPGGHRPPGGPQGDADRSPDQTSAEETRATGITPGRGPLSGWGVW
jgi:hypothetical protein